MARYCHNCNTELSARGKFCRMCGTPAPPRAKKEAILEPRAAGPAAIEVRPAYHGGQNGAQNGAHNSAHNSNDERSAVEGREEYVPPTDVLRPRAPEAASKAINRPVTAPTEPALIGLERRATGQSVEPADSNPLAPATHAIVGIFEQAGFTLRIGAFLFDLLMLMMVLLITALVASNFPVVSKWSQAITLLATVSGGIVNFLALPVTTGQSLGKRLIGIRIIATDQRRASARQILIRQLLGYPIAGAFFGLGFFWLLWDRRQQGWHDKLAGTLVVKKRFNW